MFFTHPDILLVSFSKCLEPNVPTACDVCDPNLMSCSLKGDSNRIFTAAAQFGHSAPSNQICQSVKSHFKAWIAPRHAATSNHGWRTECLEAAWHWGRRHGQQQPVDRQWRDWKHLNGEPLRVKRLRCHVGNHLSSMHTCFFCFFFTRITQACSGWWNPVWSLADNGADFLRRRWALICWDWVWTEPKQMFYV